MHNLVDGMVNEVFISQSAVLGTEPVKEAVVVVPEITCSSFSEY